MSLPLRGVNETSQAQAFEDAAYYADLGGSGNFLTVAGTLGNLSRAYLELRDRMERIVRNADATVITDATGARFRKVYEIDLEDCRDAVARGVNETVR